jgi:hypothetical protein
LYLRYSHRGKDRVSLPSIKPFLLPIDAIVIILICTTLTPCTYGHINSLRQRRARIAVPLRIIRDQHLYRPALRIGTSLKRAHGLLDRKPMRHQPPHVPQHPRLDEPNRPRPRVGVPVLKPERDLARRQPHKREAHLGRPDAHHEHRPAKAHRLDRGAHGRLRARALQRDVRLGAPHRPHDPRRERFPRLVARDAQRAHSPGRREQRLGKCEASRVEIRDDERVRAGRVCAEQRREADRSGTAYERGVAEAEARALDGGERDGEGLEERAVLEGEGLRELVAPHGGVRDVAAEEARDGGRGAKEDALAAVVAAAETGRAGVAGNARFDRDAVAWLEMCYGWMDGDDLAEIVSSRGSQGGQLRNTSPADS